ncbi:MAG: peptide chain release factor-like protein [Candidatus Eiseniibacteriota bacterium]
MPPRATPPSATARVEPRHPQPEALDRLARECDITAYRSSGPGGQKKNKTESSVRVRHRPSGLVRVATESRSQWRNRRAALERLWMALAERRRVRKARVPSAPSHGAIERRLEAKRLDAARKRLRRAASPED